MDPTGRAAPRHQKVDEINRCDHGRRATCAIGAIIQSIFIFGCGKKPVHDRIIHHEGQRRCGEDVADFHVIVSSELRHCQTGIQENTSRDISSGVKDGLSVGSK
jgi:hypothetical protein